jgi:hypothetical protein
MGSIDVTTVEHQRTFVVTEAREENGFARCAAHDTGAPAHCELYILEGEDTEMVRLQPGDRIAGALRGTSLSDVHILEKAPPPPELVLRIADIVGAIAAHGLRLPRSAEDLASRTWRRPRTHVGELATVSDAVHAELTFLLDGTSPDDETLGVRIAAAMHVHGVAIELASRYDDDGYLRGLLVLPAGPFIQVGLTGPSRPVDYLAAIVSFLNRTLADRGATVRWVAVRDDFVLAEPALVETLIARGILAGAG